MRNVDARSASFAQILGAGDATIDLVLGINGRDYRVDLGQAFRGHRFAYRPAAGPAGVEDRPPTTLVRHDLSELLGLPGTATAETGIHVVTVTGNPLIDLAILGQIYPEDTIIQGQAGWPDIAEMGKRYGARFILGDNRNRSHHNPASSPPPGVR